MPVKMPINRTKREITSKMVCNRSASFIAGKKLTKIFDLLFLIDNWDRKTENAAIVANDIVAYVERDMRIWKLIQIEDIS